MHALHAPPSMPERTTTSGSLLLECSRSEPPEPVWRLVEDGLASGCCRCAVRPEVAGLPSSELCMERRSITLTGVSAAWVGRPSTGWGLGGGGTEAQLWHGVVVGCGDLQPHNWHTAGLVFPFLAGQLLCPEPGLAGDRPQALVCHCEDGDDGVEEHIEDVDGKEGTPDDIDPAVRVHDGHRACARLPGPGHRRSSERKLHSATYSVALPSKRTPPGSYAGYGIADEVTESMGGALRLLRWSFACHQAQAALDYSVHKHPSNESLINKGLDLWRGLKD